MPLFNQIGMICGLKLARSHPGSCPFSQCIALSSWTLSIQSAPLSQHSFYLGTHPLCASSPWIYTRLLYFHRTLWAGACAFVPRINIHPLNTYSPRVNTRLLCLCRRLLAGARSSGPLVHTCPRNTYSLQVTTRPLHSHIHQTIIHLPWGGCALPLSCLRRILQIGVCSFNPQVAIRSLSTYSLQVNIQLLHPYGHQIVICSLCPHNHRAIIRHLWGGCTSPIDCFVFSTLVGTKLSSCLTSWFFGVPTSCEVCGHGFRASCIFKVPTLLMVDYRPLWGCSQLVRWLELTFQTLADVFLLFFQKIWFRPFDYCVTCVRIT